MLDLNRLYNMNCMEGMSQFPDNYFDLAIVDPPYYKGPNRRAYYGSAISKRGIKRVNYPILNTWEIPNKSYFRELGRVSKNQIIWGCNYFNYQFPPGRVVWDKCNGSSSYSDCEIASCSLHDSVRMFRYMWNGMMQGKSITDGHIMQGDKSKNEKRINSMQKPVALYRWLLLEYAKPGDRLLDTHVGSASSFIACIEAGFDYIGFEIDKLMYILASERIEEYTAQLSMYKSGV